VNDVNATVTFKIGDIQIEIPDVIIPKIKVGNEGTRVLVINNAISKLKQETGIDINKLTAEVRDTALINFIEN
jgi:hypothetical protein